MGFFKKGTIISLSLRDRPTMLACSARGVPAPLYLKCVMVAHCMLAMVE